MTLPWIRVVDCITRSPTHSHIWKVTIQNCKRTFFLWSEKDQGQKKPLLVHHVPMDSILSKDFFLQSKCLMKQQQWLLDVKSLMPKEKESFKVVPFLFNDVIVKGLLFLDIVTDHIQYPCFYDIFDFDALYDNLFLQNKMWVSSSIKGKLVTVYYNACTDQVTSFFHNEQEWNPFDENRHEPLKVGSGIYMILKPFAETIKQVGIHQYGQCVDLYLRGILDPLKNVFMYELVLHGAHVFSLGAERFLQFCHLHHIPTIGNDKLVVSNCMLGQCFDVTSSMKITKIVPKSTKRHVYNDAKEKSIVYSKPIPTRLCPSEGSSSKSWRRSDPLPLMETKIMTNKNVDEKYFTPFIENVANHCCGEYKAQFLHEEEWQSVLQNEKTNFLQHFIGIVIRPP